MTNVSDLQAWALSWAVGVPLVFAAGGALVSRRSPLFVAGISSALAFALAVVAVVGRVAAEWSPFTLPLLFDPAHLQRGVQFDGPSSAMFLLVATLGVVVVRYSRTYLAGEEGLDRYARALLLTLSSVTLLVLSNHLGVTLVAWVATSAFLHQLLTFYRNRPQAVVAAHKKFLLSRLADVFVVAALVLFRGEVGSLYIDELNAFVGNPRELSASFQVAAVFLVTGVLLKSAQLPFHGWMTQVMEAPTPVSALLHAGVVNIGGFLMIRLGPLMAAAPWARGLLLGVGLLTASIACLVMMTRVSIKVALAWSTIAQMGFMLVQCGLGAWHLALLHLLAHSLYKAHAFLNAGSVVDVYRHTSLVRRTEPTLGNLGLGIAGALLVAGGLALGVSHGLSKDFWVAGLPLALLWALSVGPALARGIAAGATATVKTSLWFAGAAVGYFAWHGLFESAMASSVASTNGPDLTWGFGWWLVAGVFAAVLVVQTIVQLQPRGELMAWLQPRLFAGLYLDEWFTRMTFRLWPPRLEARRPKVPTRVAPTQEIGSW